MAARSFLPEPASAPVNGRTKPSADGQSNDIVIIRKRSDFLAANRGKRFVTPGFVLLMYKRNSGPGIAPGAMRYGITVSRKVGNAVARNRMKRRFRALFEKVLPQYGVAGADHILIGRKQDREREFATLQADLEKGLTHLAKRMA